MKNFEYRAQARESLQGQWGVNAGIVFVAGVAANIISRVVSTILGGDGESIWSTIVQFLLGILILFAFEYGQYYIALKVSRGQRAEMGDLFTIFQGRYYVPMAVFNFVDTIIQTIVGLVIFLPIFLIAGTGLYVSYALGATDQLASIITSLSAFSTGLTIVVGLALFVVYFVLSMLIAGIFQFAAWAKLDDLSLSVGQALSLGWVLLKDRFGQYITLQLSFFGWYLLGIISVGIGFFWIAPYVNVTIASFYNQARLEKGF